MNCCAMDKRLKNLKKQMFNEISTADIDLLIFEYVKLLIMFKIVVRRSRVLNQLGKRNLIIQYELKEFWMIHFDFFLIIIMKSFDFY